MYNPQVPPQNPEELLPYLNDEFQRNARSLVPLENGEWKVQHSMPNKVKPGMVKIFDGVDANPLGTGIPGIYYYGEDNLWHFAGGVPYVPPPDPVPTAWVMITPTNGWTVDTAFHYRRWSYRVDLIVDLNAGTYADPGPVVIGSLPVGFRPSIDCGFPLVTNTLGGITALPLLRVRSNGDIDILNVPPTSLGIRTTVSIPVDNF